MRWIFLILILSSCNMQRWCNDRYPPSVASDTTIVYLDSVQIVYRDTIIEHYIPGETVIDSIFIPPEVTDFSGYRLARETGLARAETWLTSNPFQLHLSLVQKDTTLVIRLENAIKTATFWKAEYVTITERYVQYKRTVRKIHTVALIFSVVVVGLWLLRLVRGRRG